MDALGDEYPYVLPQIGLDRSGNLQRYDKQFFIGIVDQYVWEETWKTHSLFWNFGMERYHNRKMKNIAPIDQTKTWANKEIQRMEGNGRHALQNMGIIFFYMKY